MDTPIPVGLAAATVCALFLYKAAPIKADTVTLNSGDVLEGKIVSENDTQVEMQVSMYHGSIISTRELLKSDIKSMSRETEEQRQEKADYADLSQTPAASPQYSLTLDPNQEYTPAHYAAGIAVFENFLAKHPNSAHADYIHSQIVAWKSESDNVASGKVKFNNQWMTPEAKAPLVERLQKQMYVQAAQNTLASLKKKLSELQDHRDSLAEQVAAADGNLKSAHERLRTIPESLRDPIYKDYVYSNGATDRRIAGYTTVPNPERQAARDECDVYQQLVSSGPQKLANLDMKIRGIQIQIPRAEQDYANALAQVSPR